MTKVSTNVDRELLNYLCDVAKQKDMTLSDAINQILSNDKLKNERMKKDETMA